MKILCLGNNTEHTDTLARELAIKHGLNYHGLITDLLGEKFEVDHLQTGVYHSSVFDVNLARLIEIGNHCDLVTVFDQPKTSYGHPDAWMQLYQILQGITTRKEAPSTLQSIEYWNRVLDENPSICVLPWVEKMLGDSADVNAIKLCCRSDIRIDQPGADTDHWQKDRRYFKIRQHMLQAVAVPHCKSCQDQEHQGLISDRRIETLDWTNRLDLKDLASLETINAPAYIEIRANNRCNLMCRMCNPHSSHRIADEYQRLGWLDHAPKFDRTRDLFSEIDLSTVKKIYVSGGEPLLNPDLFRWLDLCKEKGHTDFECVINTNGTKLPQRLRRHLGHFPNLQFIFSIDAFGITNDYIRWGSTWKDIVDNWQYLRDKGHRVHVNTTVSVYNVHRLSTLYHWIDQTFPDTLLHINLVNGPDHLSLSMFPDVDVAIMDLDHAKTAMCVQNNQQVYRSLDFIQNTLKTAEKSDLEEFFRFNDLLDSSRGSKLRNHDPFLDAFRP